MEKVNLSENKKPITIERINEVLILLADFFKTAIGPKGLDKVLYEHFNNHMIISNDGGTIIDDLGDQFKPEYAKLILNWGRVLKKEQGDGIKTFYMQLGSIIQIITALEPEIPKRPILDALQVLEICWDAFCQNAAFKMEKIYQDQKREEKMNQVSSQIQDHELRFLKKYLFSIISGKISDNNSKHLINIIIEMLEKIGERLYKPWFDIKNHFQVVKVPGASVKESRLYNGIFLGKMPANESLLRNGAINDPRVLLIKQKLYIDLPDGGNMGPQGNEYSIKLSAADGVASLNNFSKQYATDLYKKIEKVNPNVVITEKGVAKYLEGLFERNNILLIRRAKPEEFSFLAKYLGVTPVENLDEIGEKHIAVVNSVVKEKIGRDFQILLKYNPNKKNKGKEVGSLLVCGSIWYVCEEIEVLLKKLLRTSREFLKDRRYFLGGGNTEFRFIHFTNQILAPITAQEKGHIEKEEKLPYFDNHLVDKINTLSPKAHYALKKILSSFHYLSEGLIESSGRDPIANRINIASQLVKSKNIMNPIGFDVQTGSIAQMDKKQIYENFQSKKALYKKIFSIAKQIARIDKVISKKHQIKKNQD